MSNDRPDPLPDPPERPASEDLEQQDNEMPDTPTRPGPDELERIVEGQERAWP